MTQSFISEFIKKRYGNDLTITELHNALVDIAQTHILLALKKQGFFTRAAFYGGTCLRKCCSLQRFSEDLDFSLKETDTSFSFKEYFPKIKEYLSNIGLDMEIEEREKITATDVCSAFVKANTEYTIVNIFTMQRPIKGIHPNQNIKIKFKADTNPPLHASYYEYLVLDSIYPFSVNCYDLQSQFAGKISALLMRSWKNRVKGRDFYDYLWFLKHNIPVNTKHLQARLKDNSGKDYTVQDIKELLHTRFETVSYESIKKDLSMFAPRNEMNIIKEWNSSVFEQMTEKFLEFK